MNLEKKLREKMDTKKKGFTLIELIVVIAIIGILAAVMLPKLTSFTENAREGAVRAEAKTIVTAVTAIIAKDSVDTTKQKTLSLDDEGVKKVQEITGILKGKLVIKSNSTGAFEYTKDGWKAVYSDDGVLTVGKDTVSTTGK